MNTFLTRADDSMHRSRAFDEIYDAVYHLDDLVNVFGFAASFRIWEGKKHTVFALDEDSK